MRWEREDRLWDADWTPGDFAELARRYVRASSRVPAVAREAAALAATCRDAGGLQRSANAYYRPRGSSTKAWSGAAADPRLRNAVRAWPSPTCRTRLATRYRRGARVPGPAGGLGAETCARRLDERRPATPVEAAGWRDRAWPSFDRLQREALLANPLLDFDRLLLIRRQPHGDPRRQEGTGYGVGEYIGLPRQSSKCNPGIEEPFNWDNEIAVLQPVASGRPS